MTEKAPKPCVKCGSTEKTGKGGCKPCKKLLDAAYQLKNKEKLAAKNAERYLKNRESRLASAAAYRSENKEILKEKAHDFYRRNKAKVNAASAEYYKNNKEKVCAKVEVYRNSNPSKILASKAAWKAANPGVVNIYSRNRRARKRNAGGTLSRGLSQKLFVLQKGKCACCGKPLGTDYHVDHILPLILGGSNTDDNAQLLRPRCNLQKNKKHPVDFMQSRGFLL